MPSQSQIRLDLAHWRNIGSNGSPGCFARLLRRRSFLYTLHIVDGNKMRNYISLRMGTRYLS